MTIDRRNKITRPNPGTLRRTILERRNNRQSTVGIKPDFRTYTTEISGDILLKLLSFDGRKKSRVRIPE